MSRPPDTRSTDAMTSDRTESSDRSLSSDRIKSSDRSVSSDRERARAQRDREHHGAVGERPLSPELRRDRREAAPMGDRHPEHDLGDDGRELREEALASAASLRDRPAAPDGPGAWDSDEEITPPPAPPPLASPPEAHGMGDAESSVVVTSDATGASLLGDEQSRRFRSRWDDIQASFVDEPREAVGATDALVREATDALHESFERDRRQLEGIWDRGEEVTTEDLRVTLRRYRSFFERLLAV